MKSKVVVYGLSLLFLSSCFLKQEAPGSMTQGGKAGKVESVVRLEEVRGEGTQASVEATFRAGSTRDSRRIAKRDLTETGAWLKLASLERAPSCSVYKFAKSSADDLREERATLVSAGRFWFGVSKQSHLDEISEDENHRYYKKLESNLTPTNYLIKVEGNEYVQAFEMTVTLPEMLNEVTIASVGLEDGPAIKKTAPLKIEWAAPAIAHPSHLMLLEIYDDQPDAVYLARCVAAEKDVTANGKASWTIDAKYLSVLPQTKSGEVFLSRVYARGAGSSLLEVETQGFQTEYARIAIE